jgi:hypothetical protein
VNLFHVGWLLWALAFVAIELPALVWHKNQGDTLSELVWELFAIKTKGPAWRARRFLLLAGMCWLLVHFMTGGYV